MIPARIIAPMFGVFAIIAAWLAPVHAATTLLPNGEQCFQATTGINGMVGLLGSITGGSGYVNGTYSNVALTGGVGSGATANITVAAGAVSSLTIVSPGINYVVGNALSATAASLGGSGAGFSVPVSSISINSSLAGGSVNMYLPATTTPKATWKDSGQATLNTNPIILDANGCAIIYGTGTYRQQVLDSLGNLVFDQLTTDTSAFNSTFWAGTASGTPNAITVTYPGFNATDGTIINFTALNTNTGPTTINPSGFGAITVLKATTAGSVALTGSEIIAGNPVSVEYRSSGNSFTLLTTVIQSASGAQAPLCGASGLKITNGAVPASQIAITANSLVMVNSSGLTINRSNVSLTLTITNGTVTSTANGMDGEAPGASTWIDVFAIDNGAAAASLGTAAAGFGLTPNMPSGYSYKCYLGAMFLNSGSVLLGSLQLGNKAQYVVGGSGITNANTLIMANGINGSTFSAASPTLVPVSVALFVPPTATSVRVSINASWQNKAVSNVLVAPNLAWGGAQNGPNGTNGSAWPCYVVGAQVNSQSCDMVLESTSIFYAASAAGGAVGILNWTDAVNAN